MTPPFIPKGGCYSVGSNDCFQLSSRTRTPFADTFFTAISTTSTTSTDHIDHTIDHIEHKTTAVTERSTISLSIPTISLSIPSASHCIQACFILAVAVAVEVVYPFRFQVHLTVWIPTDLFPPKPKISCSTARLSQRDENQKSSKGLCPQSQQEVVHNSHNSNFSHGGCSHCNSPKTSSCQVSSQQSFTNPSCSHEW